MDQVEDDGLDHIQSLEEILERLTPKQRAFLKAYCMTCNVTASADAAQITHTCHYTWLKIDKIYQKAFELAEPIAVAYLESVAVKRATEGYTEPVFYQGVQCGEVQKYSDSLLQFLLKGRDKRYRDRQQVTTTDADGNDAPIVLTTQYVTKKDG